MDPLFHVAPGEFPRPGRAGHHTHAAGLTLEHIGGRFTLALHLFQLSGAVITDRRTDAATAASFIVDLHRWQGFLDSHGYTGITGDAGTAG